MVRLAVIAVLVEMFLLLMAISCLIWPERIQRFVVSHGDELFFYNPFKSWVQTRYYIWQLRIIGLLALATGVFIAGSILRYLITR